MNQPLSEHYQKGNPLQQVHQGMKVYDRYVLPEQVDRVNDNKVILNVLRQDLIKR